MTRTLVIGVGNPERGDDGVGLLVARLVQRRRCADVDTVREPLDLVDRLAGVSSAVVVDACRSDLPCGTILWLDTESMRRGWTTERGLSSAGPTHGFEVVDALRLADAFGVLPQTTVVVLVVGEKFGIGRGMSKAVRQGALDVAARIADYVVGDEPRRGAGKRVPTGRTSGR